MFLFSLPHKLLKKTSSQFVDETNNVHRVAVSVQPHGNDRRGHRGDDSRDRRDTVILVVVVDADRFPASENTRATTENSIRDLALLLHLARPRAKLEDHPSSVTGPVRRFLSQSIS